MKKLIYTLAFVLIVHCTLNIENCMCQWQPDVRLTNNTAFSNISYNNAWCVASSGPAVHAVWWDNRDGNYEIYYKRSTDAGVSWGADTRLTNYTDLSWYPSIAVSGSVVHIVWVDEHDGNKEIYYKRSTDGGTTWDADTRLTNNTANSYYPSIAVSGSLVHVVWDDYRDGNREIYYKRSTDGGVSWGADIRLTIYTESSIQSSVAVSDSVLNVVWTDLRDGNWEIYYKRSTDAGLSWGTDIRLTNNTEASWTPSVAVSGSLVHVLWYDERNGSSNSEIYYKRSTDAGVSWGSDTRLTNNTGESSSPSVAVSGSLVHVVWSDSRNGSSNPEIYYKFSTNAGLSWGADTRLTNNTGLSFFAFVALSGSFVHVVWLDNRDGNQEIYYKRNPNGNPSGIINISSEIPSSYSLHQNYPNPFNPTTNVQFSMCNVQFATLKVFDILGKEVATLVNEKLSPGTYTVDWNASEQPSGVYFYKLSAGDFTDTKRMILIK